MSWGAFTRFSRTREIAMAVRDVLRADHELADWTGRRIFYGTAVPADPMPLIMTMTHRESAVQQPSVGDLEVRARILVVFAFDETRDIVPDGEHDFASVLLRTDSVLWANDLLYVNGRQYAERLEEAQDFGFEQINDASTDDEVDGTVFPARQYTYVYHRDAATGVPT